MFQYSPHPPTYILGGGKGGVAPGVPLGGLAPQRSQAWVGYSWVGYSWHTPGWFGAPAHPGLGGLLLGGQLLAHPWVVWRPQHIQPWEGYSWVGYSWHTPGWLGAPSTSSPGWVTPGWVTPGWLARSRLGLGWALLGRAGVAGLGWAGEVIGPSGLIVPPQRRASGLLSGPIGTNRAQQCGPPPIISPSPSPSPQGWAGLG